VALLWLAFAGSHVALSARGLRRSLVTGLGGERPFAGVYSLVALATFVPLVWAYATHSHGGPLLWGLRSIAVVRFVAILLAAVGIALVAASFAQPSATGMDPRAAVRAHGLTRITRHPLFSGLGLWGLAHVLVNGFASDVVFFGGFAVFGLLGAMHQDARKSRDHGRELAAFYEETSILPFAAILRGKNRLVAGELPWTALAIGLVAASVLYLLHPVVFG